MHSTIINDGKIIEALAEHDDDDEEAFDAAVTDIVNWALARREEAQANYQAAITWRERGYNVVPNATDLRHPRVEWTHRQKQFVSLAELQGWEPLFGNGVGFITGAISGVIVIDTDGLAGETILKEFEAEFGALPTTLTIRSGSGRGFHRHFKHPGYRVKTVANISIKTDIKGDGGFCVLPPSLHKSGGRYEVVCDAPIADLPAGLIEYIGQRAGKPSRSEPVEGQPAAITARGPARDEITSSTTIPRKPPPVNRTNAAIIQSMLDALPDTMAADYDTWLRVGFAIHAFDGGETGLGLWKKFSERHPEKAAATDFEKVWSGFKRPYKGKPIGIGTLWKLATDHGWQPIHFTDGLAAAVESTQPVGAGFMTVGGFTMTDRGLMKKVKGALLVKVSDPFVVIGRYRNPAGKSWGRTIRFYDADGRAHIHHVTGAVLHGEASKLAGELEAAGLWIDRSHQKDFAFYLSKVMPPSCVTLVSRTGWHEIHGKHVFVLPSETTGGDGLGETVVLENAEASKYESKGSLADWQAGVGALAVGHPWMIFVISAALSGPLAHLVDAEGGGVHFVSRSSIGKSTVTAAGASVWGRGEIENGYVRPWRATANGLEAAAAQVTHTALVLDELGMADPREVAQAVYALASGGGKGRAKRDGSAQESRTWNVTILSSGEVSVETKIEEDHWRKVKAKAGQTVRVLDIPADRELGYGAFDSTGGHANAGELSDAIRAAAITAYGTAGPEFIKRIIGGPGIIDGPGKVSSWAKKRIKKFVKDHMPNGASEQVGRAARRLGLSAASGELATALGVTPWARGDAWNAAALVLAAWIRARGGSGAYEEKQAIKQVRRLIEAHGATRFEALVKGNLLPDRPVLNRLGWRDGSGPNEQWLVLPEAWKTEVCNGLDPVAVARTLAKRGMLVLPKTGPHRSCKITVDGRQTRVYVITAAILLA